MSGDHPHSDSHGACVALIAEIPERCDQLFCVNHVRSVASRPAMAPLMTIEWMPDGGSPR